MKQNPPEHFDIYKGFINFERALHEILSKHPYPFLQGPAVAILEKLLQPDNYPLSDTDILNAKTTFRHSDSQSYFRWSPIKSGLQNWGIETGDLSSGIRNHSYKRNWTFMEL